MVADTPVDDSLVAVDADSHQHSSPSVAHMGVVVVPQPRHRFVHSSRLLNFWAEVDEIWLTGDGKVDVVSTEELIEVELLGLVQGNRPILQSDLGRVAGRDGGLAGVDSGEETGRQKDCQTGISR